jgi:nucleoside 2-deoxyribosyltransferase
VKKIYIAGPLSQGDTAANVRHAINAGEILANAGYAVFIPHLSHFWSVLHSHEHAFWLLQDLEWLAECDGMYRIPGYSPGADIEEEFCRRNGIPVYHLLSELIKE